VNTLANTPLSEWWLRLDQQKTNIPRLSIRRQVSHRKKKTRCESNFGLLRPSRRRRPTFTQRRFAFSVWFVLSCLLATGGAYWEFGRAREVRLGATLRSFDEMKFSYNGPSKNQISPMCGCWNEQDADTWRGISFAARHLTISRSGSAPLTAYVISAPWPGEIFAGGPWLGLPSKTFGPVPTSFDPSAILSQFSAQAMPESSTNIIASVQYAVIVTDQPLQIRQFGETPLGAWLPMGASTVSLRLQPALFPSSPNVVEISESYEALRTGIPRLPRTLETAYGEAEDSDSNAEVPALDLLGKRTILWTEGPNASVWLSEHFDGSSLKVGQGQSSVGVVIDPVFSARVAVIPTTREALARFAQIEKKEILPQPQDWLTVSESGAISLRLQRTADELEEFDQIAQRLKHHDSAEKVNIEYPELVQIASTGADAFLYEKKLMDFRFPPAPPSRGFSVFGPMANLVFEGALGNVMLGSKAVPDISSPSTLEFRDIKGFKTAKGFMPITVGESSAFDTKLMFGGISEAWLNGEPLNRLADRLSWSTGVIAMIAGVIQAIAAAFALLLSVFQKTK